jgi:hypothetical protein
MDHSHANAELLAVVDDTLVSVTFELFSAYEIEVVHHPDETEVLPAGEAQVFAAVIGYAGECVRGALILLAPQEVIRAWRPDEVDANEAVIDDTIGEFSNMLLGSVKNRLLARGAVLLLATPTIARGINLSLPAPAGGATRWQCFEGAKGRFFVRVDASFDAGFAFLPEAPPTDDVAAEGDMMFL